MSDRRISCIFFDLGNVLVGLNYERFESRMIALTGLGDGQLRKAFAELGPVLKYELGTCSDDEFVAEICGRLGVNVGRKEFLDAWTCIFQEKPLLPDEILSEMAEKYPLWVISNTNKIHFDFISERHRFLTDYFQGWVLSYEVGAAKPDPAIFRHALRRAGIAAPEALFVDDQQINVEAAMGLGMDAFQFLSPDQTIRELRERNLLH